MPQVAPAAERPMRVVPPVFFHVRATPPAAQGAPPGRGATRAAKFLKKFQRIFPVTAIVGGSG